MALLEANGQAVLEAAIVLPRTGGPWYADLRVDGTEIDEGEVVLLVVGGGALTLKGKARRGVAYLEAGWVRAVAGAGGLGTIQLAKFYQNVELRLPLADILRAAGETLAESASASVLETFLAFWTLQEAPCALLLQALMTKAPAGTVWRFLADGTFWVGTDAFAASDLDYDEVDRDPREERRLLVVEVPTLLPGVSLAGERVGRVEHYVDGESAQTLFYVERSA